MDSVGIYAGSFDPPTNGHEWMIRQGASLFGRLVVAIGINPAKKASYPIAKRIEWLTEMTKGLPNVEVAQFGNLFLARYAEQRGAAFMLRGIRSEADFAYEQSMRHINSDLSPNVTTVFLMPPREIAEVSSSLVRGMIGPEGWQGVVRGLVPACVFRDLENARA